jgi:hypothetical protein
VALRGRGWPVRQPMASGPDSRHGIAGAAILTTKDGALRMRRPSSLTDDQMRLRAGVPVAVAAEIRSRLGIVGTEPLDAISRIIAALGHGRDGRTVIVVLIVVVGLSGSIAVIIARPAIITLRRDGAADHSTGHRAGNEAAATTMIAVTVGVTATIATTTAELCRRSAATAEPRTRRAATATAKPRPWRAAAATNPRTRRTAAVKPRPRRAAATHMRGTAATWAGSRGSRARLAIRNLSEACGWRQHWQNQRHCRSGTQNFKTDHCRLHTRDTAQPVRSADVPEPRTDCARYQAVRSELYAE